MKGKGRKAWAEGDLVRSLELPPGEVVQEAYQYSESSLAS